MAKNPFSCALPLRAIVLTIALAVAGCSDSDVSKDAGPTPDVSAAADTTPTPDAAPTPDAPTPDTAVPDSTAVDAKPAVDAAPKRSVPISVTDQSNRKPVSGAKACVVGMPTLCATTASTGKATIKNVPVVDVTIEVTKASYLTTHVPLGQTNAERSVNHAIFTTVLAGQLAGLIGSKLDPTKGVLAAGANDAAGKHLAGVSFTLDKKVGVGPTYFTSTGLPDKKLTATSSGIALAVVLNVPAGDYEIAASHKTLKCAAKKGWPKAGATGTVRARAVASVATIVTFVCK